MKQFRSTKMEMEAPWHCPCCESWEFDEHARLCGKQLSEILITDLVDLFEKLYAPNRKSLFSRSAKKDRALILTIKLKTVFRKNGWKIPGTQELIVREN